MLKWLSILLLFLLLAGGGFLLLGTEITAGWFGPDWVEVCDQLTAHPEDADRRAVGVPDEELVPAKAVEACHQAALLDGENARLRFQYGRALDAAGYTDEAAETFHQAAGLGSCAAKAFLADYYLHGAIADGEGTETETARRLYEEAAPCFPPAAAAASMLTYRPDKFHEPEAMTALYEGRIDDLNLLRPLVASYVRGIDSAAGMPFHPVGTECLQWAQTELRRNLEAAEQGDPRNLGERAWVEVLRRVSGWAGGAVDPVRLGDLRRYQEDLEELGAKDGLLLFERHGCEGPVIEQVFDSVEDFLRRPKPLEEVVLEIQARSEQGLPVTMLRAPQEWIAQIGGGA